jgi:tRNA (guanine-N7-)-methyltransferase
VRRSRRLPAEALAPYSVAVPDPPTPLDWRMIFGNANPVEIEVGFGKGLFILTASQARPEVNLLGVEIERKYCLYTATRIAKRRLLNVRIVHADARPFLRDCVAAQAVQAVHVFFPDPWWKKRHHKRRLFTAAFVAECARAADLPRWSERLS